MRLVVGTMLILAAFLANAETVRSLPAATIVDLKGNGLSSTSLLDTAGLTVISFWATWCKPCLQELDNINEVYATWRKETGVKVVAVSIDDAGVSAKLPAFVNGRGWSFPAMLDRNGDFKRALHVNNVPHLVVATPKGAIVHTHLSYTAGDEKALYKVIKTETERLKTPPPATDEKK